MSLLMAVEVVLICLTVVNEAPGPCIRESAQTCACYRRGGAVGVHVHVYTFEDSVYVCVSVPFF